MKKFNLLVKKSIGALFVHQKTKDRSPSMLGRLVLQQSLILVWAKQLQDSGKDEVECNCALWSYSKNGKRYVTIEISPYYPAKPKESANDNSVDQFFKEITKQPDSCEEDDDTET